MYPSGAKGSFVDAEHNKDNVPHPSWGGLNVDYKRFQLPKTQGSSPVKQSTAYAGITWALSHSPVGTEALGTRVNTDALATATAVSNKIFCLLSSVSSHETMAS